MEKEHKYVIVGAGLAGIILAERIANILKEKVLIIERRNHIGGATYDCYDDYGVLIGKYGPHTFHTNDMELKDYILKFCDWNYYVHKAKSFVNDKFVSFPINNLTIKDLYGVDLKEEEAEEFINEHKEDIINKFFVDFTFKQWGCDRSELDQSVISRIPFRNNNDDRYFTDVFQGNPVGGYTKMFEKMLDNPLIEIRLNTDYKDIINSLEYYKLIYTGPIDYYFDYKLGKLRYRSVNFNFEHYNCDSFQPIASTRYPGKEYPYTRITEFKKMTGQKVNGTTILKEIPCFGDDPFYPYPTKEWKDLAQKYRELAKMESNTFFVGRLAEYKYYDMDDVFRRALDTFESIKEDYIHDYND